MIIVIITKLVCAPLSRGTKILLHICVALNSFKIWPETTIKVFKLRYSYSFFKKVNPPVSH